MIKATLKMKRLHLATLSALAALHGLADASPVTGKRIDNGRVDFHAVRAPAEVEPGQPYALPSGVSRGDATAMRAAANTLPTRSPEQHIRVDDSGIGALFASGKAELTDSARQRLDAIAAQLQGKQGIRLSVVGHTDNQHLSANSRRLFRDNQGLSEARALAVADYLRRALGLAAEQVAIGGRGESAPIAANGSPEGMARNRRVEVSAWYEGAPAAVAPVTQAACAAQATQADLPFRITVDGEPVALNEPATEADRQRCTDVALAKADIQIKYDDLAARPALNVWTTPDVVVQGESVDFRGYANYVAWIAKAEVRIFKKGQKPDESPLAVLPLGWDKPAAWRVPAENEAGAYGYLLRVYDRQGHFDETALKSFDVVAHRRPVSDMDKPEREALTGWGENSLTLRNIPVAGGTITVSGRDLKPGQRIAALGLEVPVGREGRFALRQILPSGPQTVEVKLTEADGKAATFRRNVSIPDNDWFYVAVGDLTVGRNRVVGPAELVTGDTQHYSNDTYVDGRGAFYLKGKIKGDWLLTAAADTREQPFKDLFTNFSSKDPRYLLRNIDPNAYYPVYGDDSTTVDDAPTQGKFYVRLEKGDSHVMWGNFQTQWSGSELIQYSRGLYGAKVRYRSEEATSFGEKRTAVDGFAADPGSLGARDEFRGTGGSLYYLRHQDITQGSERLWVEVRDKDSGLVLERKELTPSQDYEVNYIQGRILLREPLSSTAGGGLVLTSTLSGQPLHLVATYEYVPGVTAVSSMATGVRASQWLNDTVKVGVTAYHQGETGAEQTLKGADVTVRVAPGTTVKAEVARSSGVGSGAGISTNGGFGFNAVSAADANATAKRIDATVDFAEVVDGAQGKISAYWQDKERGFSGPGQLGYYGEAVRQQGLRADVPIGKADQVAVKVDVRDADSQDTRNAEVAWKHRLGEQWALSLGARHDERETRVANASPLLSQNGKRLDAIARADYQPLKDGGKPGEKEDWAAYGFVQGTAERTGNRDANNRAGVGASWQVNDRFRLNAEASDGNLGIGGRIGADYRISDRSNAYLNYVMETENPNYAYRGRTGTWVTGSEYRVSDGMRLFGENRITSGSGPQSLTQAFGVDLSPNDRWNYGLKFETGTISDPLAGDLKRNALGLSVGYKEGKTKYTGNLEFRDEDSNLSGSRHTWLMRNTLGHQYNAAWRMIGKLNISRSSNSQGAFYDGNYHELVLGAAYRPVNNDRWNTLIKYTNYYNLPSPGQITASGSVADYSQKSQVLSVDTIYDVLPWLSLGAKYGLRIGELRDNRADGDWYSSRADLLVLRADLHFVKEWDAVLEARDLRAREAKDAKAGALVAVYRHVGENVKLGVGYNFTTYSDDLTDLSFRSRGWFMNALATY